MENNNSSRKTTKKEERDEILGRALSKTIKSDAIADQCPPLEDLSAFIDGTLDEQRRDTIMGHLSHCDKCYEVVSMAREMVEEEKKQKLIAKSWYYAPIAIAAAAVLAIVFKFVIQTPTHTHRYPPLRS